MSTNYYVIERELVGPNIPRHWRESGIQVGGRRVTIETTQPHLYGHTEIDGPVGEIDGVAIRAHGEYESYNDAVEAVRDKWTGVKALGRYTNHWLTGSDTDYLRGRSMAFSVRADRKRPRRKAA